LEKSLNRYRVAGLIVRIAVGLTGTGERTPRAPLMTLGVGGARLSGASGKRRILRAVAGLPLVAGWKLG
jgi:hypothetical protein